jgi:hypothetical protein
LLLGDRGTEPPDSEARREALPFFCVSVWSFARSMQRHLWGFHEDDEAFQREVREKLDPARQEASLLLGMNSPKPTMIYLKLLTSFLLPTFVVLRLTNPPLSLPMQWERATESSPPRCPFSTLVTLLVS